MTNFSVTKSALLRVASPTQSQLCAPLRAAACAALLGLGFAFMQTAEVAHAKIVARQPKPPPGRMRPSAVLQSRRSTIAPRVASQPQPMKPTTSDAMSAKTSGSDMRSIYRRIKQRMRAWLENKGICMRRSHVPAAARVRRAHDITPAVAVAARHAPRPPHPTCHQTPTHSFSSGRWICG